MNEPVSRFSAYRSKKMGCRRRHAESRPMSLSSNCVDVGRGGACRRRSGTAHARDEGPSFRGSSASASTDVPGCIGCVGRPADRRIDLRVRAGRQVHRANEHVAPTEMSSSSVVVIADGVPRRRLRRPGGLRTSRWRRPSWCCRDGRTRTSSPGPDRARRHPTGVATVVLIRPDRRTAPESGSRRGSGGFRPARARGGAGAWSPDTTACCPTRVDDVVPEKRGDRDEGQVVDSRASREKSVKSAGDLGVPVLGPVDEVHLVHGHDDVRDARAETR